MKVLPEGSQTSEKTTKWKPPSRRSSWYERFFELLGSRKVELVDLDFIKINITPDKGDAGRFLAGLKFLGLIGNEGKATKEMDRLKLTGDDFKKNLKEVIRRAYSDVFDKTELETVKRDNLVNFFIERYDLSANVASDAVDLFVYFTNKADIPLSASLKAVTPPIRPAKEEPARLRMQSRPTQQRKLTEIIPEGMEELKLGNVRIWLPKADKTAAETAKRLIDLYMETHLKE